MNTGQCAHDPVNNVSHCDALPPKGMKSIALFALAVLAAAQVQPKPTQYQLAHMQKNSRSMFQHFGPCTFNGCQWDTALWPASSFAPPDDMNTDNWFETAKLLGANEICLTVVRLELAAVCVPSPC